MNKIYLVFQFITCRSQHNELLVIHSLLIILCRQTINKSSSFEHPCALTKWSKHDLKSLGLFHLSYENFKLVVGSCHKLRHIWRYFYLSETWTHGTFLFLLRNTKPVQITQTCSYFYAACLNEQKMKLSFSFPES